MNNYILGSHNSMTYLKPTKWWMRPLAFMARCQKVDIYDQYFKYGVRLFDLRVRIDKNGNEVFCHGYMEYEKEYVYSTLFNLNDWAKLTNETVYVRLILEMNGPTKDQEWQESKFKELCKNVDSLNLNNVVVFGGMRKYDWKNIYQFKAGQLDHWLDDKYSSTTSFFKSKSKLLAVLDDWFPWLYAKTHNKKNIKKGTEKKCLFIDFVNIQ